jgi:hypothetical protein
VADTDKAEERIGTVHAALADTTTVMFATSWVLRTRRRHEQPSPPVSPARRSLVSPRSWADICRIGVA